MTTFRVLKTKHVKFEIKDNPSDLKTKHVKFEINDNLSGFENQTRKV